MVVGAHAPRGFVGFCDDAGHFKLDDAKAFLAYIAEHYQGEEVVLVPHKRSYLRSLRANGYYWSVVVKAAVTESGQDADTVHAVWCDLFLPDEKKRVEFFNRMTGQKISLYVDSRRTSKLDGSAFYDFVEHCRLWLQEFLGVTTPDPDPDYWRKRKAAHA